MPGGYFRPATRTSSKGGQTALQVVYTSGIVREMAGKDLTLKDGVTIWPALRNRPLCSARCVRRWTTG